MSIERQIAQSEDYQWPPLRTDDICIGTLQLASKMAAQKANALYPEILCAMWVQLDAEIGILFRGLRLSDPVYSKSKNVRVRYDNLKDATKAEQVIADALAELASQL